MDTYSFARKPAPQEHDAVLSFIRHFRRKDILTGIIFAIIGCGLTATGIYAVIDGFQYAAGFIIASAVAARNIIPNTNYVLYTPITRNPSI